MNNNNKYNFMNYLNSPYYRNDITLGESNIKTSKNLW